MLQGNQTWVFPSRPVILSSTAIGGPMESEGPLADDFDSLHADSMMGQVSWEQAEKMILEEACMLAIDKAGLVKEDINFFLGGDLMNQIISTTFTARTIGVPYLGMFGACSVSMASLAVASLLLDSQSANYTLAATSSHNSSAEKQYRNPTEYGGQKPPTSQWTATAAGASVLSRHGEGLRVTSATIGSVVDMGLQDPFNMGAAMAPAALHTIEAHFRDLKLPFDYYDLIVTGDLGKVGYSILQELLPANQIQIPLERYRDCGMLLYGDNPNMFSGGSGAGCSACVTYGHLFNRMRRGEIKKMLVVATGALHSPISFQQGESIPCIAHAVSIETE